MQKVVGIWRNVPSVRENVVWAGKMEKLDIVEKVIRFAWQELLCTSGKNLALQGSTGRERSFFQDAD